MLHSITCFLSVLGTAQAAFIHPGLLHTADDFTRITTNVNAANEPWITGWNKLIASSYADASYTPQAVSVIYRGSDGVHAENYPLLYEDVAAAYVLAIRWKITQNSTYGDAAVAILDDWSSTLTELGGDSDLYLSAGIYGYEFAQAGEIMRDYEGWTGLDAFITMMVDVFYSKTADWFANHDAGTYGGNAPGVYAGWDLCNMASAVAIGILADDETIYDQGANYFVNGTTNGAQDIAIPYLHWYDNQVIAQTQEAGRDQGHNMLDVALLSMLGKMTYNQGNDLLSYNSSVILAASEYVARYNLGYDVPYTPYSNSELDLPTISAVSRGDVRPVWELLYNHYGVLKGLNVTWTKQYRDFVVANNSGAEGGSGDYGYNSGGYDQLGWGTLLYTLDADAGADADIDADTSSCAS